MLILFAMFVLIVVAPLPWAVVTARQALVLERHGGGDATLLSVLAGLPTYLQPIEEALQSESSSAAATALHRLQRDRRIARIAWIAVWGAWFVAVVGLGVAGIAGFGPFAEPPPS